MAHEPAPLTPHSGAVSSTKTIEIARPQLRDSVSGREIREGGLSLPLPSPTLAGRTSHGGDAGGARDLSLHAGREGCEHLSGVPSVGPVCEVTARGCD